ncbi:MAG TPA: hypothetical protein VK826_09310 [Bacteroidia bacterium]|nr:hypothetical protein [Bacteroidia bacterium]
MAKNKIRVELVTNGNLGRQSVSLENFRLAENNEWEQEPPPYPIRAAMKVIFIVGAKTENKDAEVSFQVTGSFGTANITAFNRGGSCWADIHQDGGLTAEIDGRDSGNGKVVINIGSR